MAASAIRSPRPHRLASRWRSTIAPMGSRRDFLKQVGSTGMGLGLGPALASCLQGRAEAAALAGSQAVKTGKATHITILHTSDIHAQLEIHDEFFYEGGRPAFKRRGGLATLRTMIDALRQQNPQHTLVVDGGDCFQGSAVAALSKGQAIPPLLNRIRYDLVLPGNWEGVYGGKIGGAPVAPSWNMFAQTLAAVYMFMSLINISLP